MSNLIHRGNDLNQNYIIMKLMRLVVNQHVNH